MNTKITKATSNRIGENVVSIFKQVARCPLAETTAGPHKPMDFYEVRGDLVARCRDCGCALHLSEILMGTAVRPAGTCSVQ